MGRLWFVQHLVAAGYKHIAFLRQQISVNVKAMVTMQAARGAAIAATMKEAGLGKNIQVVYAGRNRARRRHGTDMLERANRPDAIFCWTDFICA